MRSAHEINACFTNAPRSSAKCLCCLAALPNPALSCKAVQTNANRVKNKNPPNASKTNAKFTEGTNNSFNEANKFFETKTQKSDILLKIKKQASFGPIAAKNYILAKHRINERRTSFLAYLSAPASNKNRMQFTWQLRVAQISDVLPYCARESAN